MRRWAAALIFPFAVACGKPAEEPPQPAEVSVEAPQSRTARVRAVDLDGKPLAGMVPIVTRQPNAFDEPLATGAPTGTDGLSSVEVPADRDVSVRVWDETFGRFPANYFDVLAGGAAVEEVMTVVMAEASAVTVQVFLPGGAVAAEEEMLLRLIHPAEGEWWPAPGKSDRQGMVRFEPVPAGAYSFELVTRNGYGVELPEQTLPPGGVADLGAVVVTPRSGTETGQESQ